MRSALIVEGKIHTENLSVIDMYKINNTILKLIKQKPYARRRNDCKGLSVDYLLAQTHITVYTYA